MQTRIMMGQIPITLNLPNEASIEQGDTNLAATNNISPQNSNNNENAENGKEVNSASQSQSSSRKRKHSYRHTKSQIDAMEAFFNECPHPDDTQRKELAREIGLDHIQVKFWFQNKRTHTKVRSDRMSNYELRVENEKLAAQNLSCRHALWNVPCGICRGLHVVVPGHPRGVQELIHENERLKEQIEHVKKITSKYTSPNASTSISPTISTESENTVSAEYIIYLTRFVELNKTLIKEMATTSMEELIKKIEYGMQLWIPNIDGRGYVLNEEEYFKAFPTGVRRNGFHWRNECSMDSAIVMASPLQIVEAFMEMNKWMAVYPSLVSKASSFYKLTTIGREETKDGDLQLISAEFQVPCPIIPTRETIFMRQCKRLNQHTWAIVDVSLESILPNLHLDPSIKCLKWPSGCIIQELPNGLSKVTWVEHVVVNDEDVHHLVRPIRQSGVMYGATRWMSALERQCDRIAYTFAEIDPENLYGTGAEHVERSMSVLKLSERICREYFGGPTTSDAYGWTYVSGDGVNDVRVMKKDNVDNTRTPFGVILSASHCVQLPIPPEIVFDFIRSATTRSEWDIFCIGAEIVEETIRFATGPEGNGVSVLRVEGHEERQNMLIIQETNTEPTLSSITYAPLDADSVMRLLSDEANLDNIRTLPSGFTIIPTKLSALGCIGGYREPTSSLVGTLLTASFQILHSPYPCENVSDQSIEVMKSIVETALQSINNALMARFG